MEERQSSHSGRRSITPSLVRTFTVLAPRSRPRWNAVPAVLLILVATAGCDSSPSRTSATTTRPRLGGYVDVAGAPVLQGGVQQPGSAIGDGFVVAEGSLLLGTTFATGPHLELHGRSIADDGWKALLFVTGDVQRVLGDYIEQARDAGIPADPLRCSEPRGPTESEDCWFEGSVGERGRSRGINGEFVRGSPNPESHLMLTYSDPDGADAGEPPEPYDTLDEPTTPFPAEWPRPPTVGEGFGVLVSLERNSRLVAPPATGGIRRWAVVAIYGSAIDVLDRYARQLESRRWRRVEQTPRHRDFADLRVSYGVMDAGVTFTATPVTGELAFMLVEASS
jgi:hypothetical protein